jgi:hypothetical protein
MILLERLTVSRRVVYLDVRVVADQVQDGVRQLLAGALGGDLDAPR